MINNNPYNLPERAPSKQARIYTESQVGPYRPELIDSAQGYPQFLPKPPTQGGLIIKNGEELAAFRHVYSNEAKNFFANSKGHQPVATGFQPINKSRSGMLVGSSVEKKQPLPPSNAGVGQGSQRNIADMRELSQKVQALSAFIKGYDKRISQLQKSYTAASITNNVKNLEQEPQPVSYVTASQFQQFMSKFEGSHAQMTQSIVKIKEEIGLLKLEYKASMVKPQNQRQKLRDSIQSARSLEAPKSPQKSGSDDLRKQLQYLRNSLEEKLRKNFELLSSIINKAQRQIHNGLINMPPNFKPSPIKCSTSALLLRFVECFKVRKHSPSGGQNKSGEIKITLTDNTYYIDSEGYLLDREQAYLLDSQDRRAKLEDRHIRLLKQEGVLL